MNDKLAEDLIVILAGQDDAQTLVNNQEFVDALQQAVINAPRDIDMLATSLFNALTSNAWMDRIDHRRGKRFRSQSFVKFVTDPLPEGLGTTIETLRKLLNDYPEELVLLEQALDHGPGAPEGNTNAVKKDEGEEGETNHDVVMNCPLQPPQAEQGNSKSYAIRRLTRERPDLLEKVRKGETSCNAAMIEAGFRKVPTILDVLKKAWARATPQEREAFRKIQEATS